MIPNSSVITEQFVSTPSRRDRKRQETKDRLFEAAMTLLEQKDFDAVTVQMITESADVGKGTFFNHFESKEHVVGYFFERQFVLFAQTPIFHPESLPTEISIWDQTRAALHLLMEQHAKRDKRLTRTLMSLTLTNPIAQEASFLVKSRVKEIMTQVIGVGQERGELRQDLPVLMLTEYMMSFYFYTLWRWASPETQEPLDTLLDTTYQLILEGVCVQQA